MLQQVTTYLDGVLNRVWPTKTPRLADKASRIADITPSLAEQLEEYYGHPVTSDPKIQLMEAARRTFSATVFSTDKHIDPTHANSANWVIEMLNDTSLPAKRRLHLAVDMADVGHSGPVENVVKQVALTTFEELVRSPMIGHKFRLRAARSLLRSTEPSGKFAGPEKAAAKKAIAELAPVSGKPVVDSLPYFTVFGPYPNKALKGDLLGTTFKLPLAPKAHVPGSPAP